MSRITLSERTAIEAGIYAKLSLSEIAKKIRKTTIAVSREIRTNCTRVPGFHPNGNDCHMATGCKRKHLCGEQQCNGYCVHCRNHDCRTICKQYNNSPCTQLSKPPYVCNVCGNRRICKADRAYYIAAQADATAKRRYSDSRRGPHLSKAEMDDLDALVSPLIRKGQPLNHIFSSHSSEIPISQRTLYNYIENGHLAVGNLDLRRKVGYRPRRKKKDHTTTKENKSFRKERTFQHFEQHIAENPGIPYVEMDTVKGRREQGKRMLTMIFTQNDLMLMFIMPDGTANSVVDVFDWLTNALGLETFRTLFPVILTDNGSEFNRVMDLEQTWDGVHRTQLFYCDPQASWQKPHIEKNHEFIRYVLPKGKSLSPYDQNDMMVLMSHINSTKRRKHNGKSPMELAVSPEFEKLKKILEIEEVPADDIILSPKLLRRSDR